MSHPPGTKDEIALEGGEWIKASDGVEIYTKTWKSAIQPPKATMVALHGLNEHVNRLGYNWCFAKLAEAGIQVHAFDQRGFGRTGWLSGDRGYSGGIDQALRDIDEALTRATIAGVPLFLFGHSMGGGLANITTLKFHQKHDLAGVITSSPAIAVNPSQEYPWIVTQIGRLVAWTVPRLSLPNTIMGEHLSSVADQVVAYFADPYVFHQQILIGTMFPVFQEGEKMIASEHKTWPENLPAFCLLGEKDMLISPKAIKDVITNLSAKDKKLKIYEGAQHEIVHEVAPLPDIFMTEIKNWTLAHAQAKLEGKQLTPEGELIELVPRNQWSKAKL